MLEQFFGQEIVWTELALALAAVIVVAFVVAGASARLTRRILAGVAGQDPTTGLPIASARAPIRAVRVGVFILVVAALGSPVFELIGVQIPGMNSAALTEWLLGPGLRVLLVALLTYLLLRVVALAVERLEQQLRPDQPSGASSLEDVRRITTLGRLIKSVVSVVIVGVASLIVLRELQVDIMPILTGAGILGLAVGFGAQTLVKDVIAGFFLILENQVRVGDVAQINGTGGLVEAINIRTIVLRDQAGAVHVFPNGSIATLANLTKDFSYAVLEIGVAYKEDTDVVVGILREVADTLAQDEAFTDAILEPLDVLGVEALADSQVTIKVRLKTIPLSQFKIGRELRRRIKKAFDEHGIEIPFPHLSVYVGEASKPFQVRQVD